MHAKYILSEAFPSGCAVSPSRPPPHCPPPPLSTELCLGSAPSSMAQRSSRLSPRESTCPGVKPNLCLKSSLSEMRYRYPSLPLPQFTLTPVYRYPSLPLPQFTLTPVHRYPSLLLIQFTVTPVYRYPTLTPVCGFVLRPRATQAHQV